MKPLEPFLRIDKPGASYYVRFEVRGKAYLWCTKTGVKSLAKKRGENYRAEVVAERYHLVDSMKARSGAATFQQLIDDYKTFPEPMEATRNRNCAALLQMLKASDIKATDTLDRIGAPMAIEWRKRGIKDGLAVATVNRVLRSARSLFSKDAMLLYKPANKPNADRVRDLFSVPALREPEKRPELPDSEADAKAHAGLQDRPEFFRAYLLARYCGLRRGESIAARKSWIEVKPDGSGTLYVGGREFHAKSRRWRAVAIPAQVVTILLASPTDSLVGEYPCVVLKKLSAVLADYGFPADKPYHSLRRLFGSIVYTQFGPRLARDALGHREQSTTDRSYARSLDAAPPIAYAG